METVGSSKELRERLGTFFDAEEPVVVVNTHNWQDPERFVEAVREARGATFDFDGTLHPGNQWREVGQALMPAEIFEQDREDANAYFGRSGA